MPTGWDEFLEKIKRQREQGERLDPHAIWSEFLQHSQKSPRAEALQLVAEIVQKVPIDHRASIAILLASFLTPWEWPPEWVQLRTRLEDALGEVQAAADPQKRGTIGALLQGLISADEHYILLRGSLVLTCAKHLLSTCRHDDLRYIATLCEIGLSQMMFVFSRELIRRTGQPLDEALLEARIRFDVAFERYAQAARSLNSAVGEVLFSRLDERLGKPKS